MRIAVEQVNFTDSSSNQLHEKGVVEGVILVP